MNSIDIREKFAGTGQRPSGAPWLVICSLAATVAFLLGHSFWSQSASSLRPPALISTSARGSRLSVPFKGNSQNPVADIVASVEPSVVSIDTRIRAKENGEISLSDLLHPPSGKSGSVVREPERYEAHGSGSGVIIRSDGYILTNAHVVKDAREIKITLSDGRVYTARVFGRDAYSDIAVLRISADGLPVGRLGESNNVRPGDWAIAIGTPLGLSHTVTMGIVSAIGRSLADLNNNVDLIQTDAAINPGNSGGPLLNINGEVIGINMAIRTDAQNIGFSIPIDVAKDAINSILSNRPILHPYLGISMVDFDSPLALARSGGLSTRRCGVMVSKVVSDGPAAESGVNAGDLIESVNDVPVRTGGDVQRIVRGHKVGTRVDLELVRSGRLQRVPVTLQAFPQASSDNS